MALAHDSLECFWRRLVDMKCLLIRVQVALAVASIFAATACRRSNDDSPQRLGSLIFDTASPEAQQALSSPVDFRLSEENFAEWEQAQRNLDALPKSALPTGGSSAGNPIDRAVERLESSPRARTAIERTGLTVRDFVLETLALAQATEATATTKPAGGLQIPPANLQFVEAHRARVLLARRQERRASDDQSDEQADTPIANAAAATTDTAVGVNSNEQSTDGATSSRESRGGREPRDTARPIPEPQPPQDTSHDTIPPPIRAPLR
jgi:hypothetical protein